MPLLAFFSQDAIDMVGIAAADRYLGFPYFNTFIAYGVDFFESYDIRPVHTAKELFGQFL
jgi:hypothetical protein